ncbi:hypothetical protein D9M70_601200 [compost metagenome]
MALQYNRNAIHTPARMPFDEGKLAQMQRTVSLVAQHRRGFSIEGMRALELAGDYFAAATCSVTQADGVLHGLGTPPLGDPNLKGSAPRFWRFFSLRASLGGRIICTVRLPSAPA